MFKERIMSGARVFTRFVFFLTAVLVLSSARSQSLENAVFSIGNLSFGNSDFNLGESFSSERSNEQLSFGIGQGYFLNSCRVNGGQLTLLGSESYCSADNTVEFSLSLTGDQGDNSVWGLTPLTSSNVLGISFSGPQFNISDLDGQYRIWHMRYRDDVVLSGISDATDLEGCYDLANPVVISVFDLDGGVITTNDNTIFCVGEGVPKSVSVELSGASGPASGFGIVGADGVIIAVSQSLQNFNLDLLTPGEYRVFHGAFLNFQDATGATNISDIQGCFDSSNPIFITAEDCSAQEIVNFQLSPNPASEFIQILIDDEIARSEIVNNGMMYVFDLSGKLVYEKVLSNQSDLTQNVSSLSNGVYIVEIRNKSQRHSELFFKH
jgi:hypothetical protein